jgi:hypothetical protein
VQPALDTDVLPCATDATDSSHRGISQPLRWIKGGRFHAAILPLQLAGTWPGSSCSYWNVFQENWADVAWFHNVLSLLSICAMALRASHVCHTNRHQIHAMANIIDELTSARSKHQEDRNMNSNVIYLAIQLARTVPAHFPLEGTCT